MRGIAERIDSIKEKYYSKRLIAVKFMNLREKLTLEVVEQVMKSLSVYKLATRIYFYRTERLAIGVVLTISLFFITKQPTTADLNPDLPYVDDPAVLQSCLCELPFMLDKNEEAAVAFQQEVLEIISNAIDGERPANIPDDVFVKTKYYRARWEDELLRAVVELEFFIIRQGQRAYHDLIVQVDQGLKRLDPEVYQPPSNKREKTFAFEFTIFDIIDLFRPSPEYKPFGKPAPYKGLRPAVIAFVKSQGPEDDSNEIYRLLWNRRTSFDKNSFNPYFRQMTNITDVVEVFKELREPISFDKEGFIKFWKELIGQPTPASRVRPQPIRGEVLMRRRFDGVFLEESACGTDDPFLYFPYRLTWATNSKDIYHQPFFVFERYGFLSSPSWVDLVVLLFVSFRIGYIAHMMSMGGNELDRYLFYKKHDSWWALFWYGITLTGSEMTTLLELWINYRQTIVYENGGTIRMAENTYQSFILVWKRLERLFPWKEHRQITQLSMKYWPKYLAFKAQEPWWRLRIPWLVAWRFSKMIRTDFSQEELTPPKGWQSSWVQGVVND